MRSIGILTKWNDERGFGFITPNQAGDEVFVHISAFPRDGIRPSLGETLSFESTVVEGKNKALNIQRAGGAKPKRNTSTAKKKPAYQHDGRSGLWLLVAVALLAAGYVIYGQFAQHETEKAAVLERERPRSDEEIRQAIRQSLNDGDAGTYGSKPTAKQNAPTTAAAFQCDGRIHCSDMRSYEEAKFFISNCPNTKMDGDRDGEPCEDQFSRF